MTKSEKTAPKTKKEVNKQKNQNDKKIIDLESQINDLKEQLKTSNEQNLRVVAQSENDKKRFEKEIQSVHKYSISNFAQNLLAVLDALQKGLKMADEIDNIEVKNFAKGLKLTEQEFLKCLDQANIKAIHPLNEQFDPNFHQALTMVEQKDKKSNTIIEVVQTGYMIYDRILRPASVIVVK